LSSQTSPDRTPLEQEDGAEVAEGAQEEFNRVAREIEERREFLDSMKEAGKGSEYEPMIKAQIAEKVVPSLPSGLFPSVSLSCSLYMRRN